MRRNLGEILRANGDLEEAVVVLRGVVQEQEDAGIYEDQVCFWNQLCRTVQAPRATPAAACSTHIRIYVSCVHAPLVAKRPTAALSAKIWNLQPTRFAVLTPLFWSVRCRRHSTSP